MEQTKRLALPLRWRGRALAAVAAAAAAAAAAVAAAVAVDAPTARATSTPAHLAPGMHGLHRQTRKLKSHTRGRAKSKTKPFIL